MPQQENDFTRAEAALRAAAKLNGRVQQAQAGEILTAFEIFWRSNPTRAKFGEVCKGLTLTPEMHWTMVRVR